MTKPLVERIDLLLKDVVALEAERDAANARAARLTDGLLRLGGEDYGQDECELCGGKGEVIAVTVRARGNEDIACPLCLQNDIAERARALIEDRQP